MKCLHTADWQIGMRAILLPPENLRSVGFSLNVGWLGDFPSAIRLDLAQPRGSARLTERRPYSNEQRSGQLLEQQIRIVAVWRADHDRVKTMRAT